MERRNTLNETLYLLLFHQLRIGTIVYDSRAENGSSERTIYFFCVDVFQFTIKYEFIPFFPQTDRRFPSQ